MIWKLNFRNCHCYIVTDEYITLCITYTEDNNHKTNLKQKLLSCISEAKHNQQYRHTCHLSLSTTFCLWCRLLQLDSLSTGLNNICKPLVLFFTAISTLLYSVYSQRIASYWTYNSYAVWIVFLYYSHSSVSKISTHTTLPRGTHINREVFTTIPNRLSW